MTILERVALLLRTKHEHDFRLRSRGDGYRAVCACGVDAGPVDVSRLSVLYGYARRRELTALDFHAGEQH